MRAGISTASLFLKQNNADAVETFAEWGVPVAEVFLTSFREYNEAFGSLLAAQKKNVVVNSVHTLTEQYEPQLFSVSKEVEEDAYAILKNVMEAARAMGAKYYTFHGVGRLKRKGNYDNYDYLSPKTRKIYEFCKNYGVTLAFENVEWATYNHPGVFRALKRDCPDLKAVLDVKQARISGFDYKEYIADMGGSLAYVHLSDTDENGNTCLTGKGVFDVGEFLRRLADVGFDGDILLENYAKDYKETEELKNAYLYLQEKIYKLGL